MKSAIVIYIITGLVSLFYYWLPFILKWRNKRNEKWFFASAVLFWFTFAFNIDYTGYFGWNAYAKSIPELILDGMTGLLQVVAFLWYYKGYSMRRA